MIVNQHVVHYLLPVFALIAHQTYFVEPNKLNIAQDGHDDKGNVVV